MGALNVGPFHCKCTNGNIWAIMRSTRGTCRNIDLTDLSECKCHLYRRYCPHNWKWAFPTVPCISGLSVTFFLDWNYNSHVLFFYSLLLLLLCLLRQLNPTSNIFSRGIYTNSLFCTLLEFQCCNSTRSV